MQKKRNPEVDLLCDLISIPSVVAEEKVAEEVYSFASDMGMDVKYQDVLPDRPNVIGSYEFSSEGPTLLFNAHMDTVPPGEGWITDPFVPVIKDGKIYGRGSMDDKGPLSSILVAIQRLIANPDKLEGKVVLTAVVDEEDFSRGARKLVEEVKGDFCILGEATECRVASCHKGSFRPLIHFKGKTAHTTFPDQGVNAIEAASVFVNEVKEMTRNLKSIKHPLLGSPTATVVKIEGGVKANMVPDQCELLVDRRMIPTETEAAIVEDFNKICKKVEACISGVKVSIKELQLTTGGPSELSLNNNFFKDSLKLVSDITGKPSGPIGLQCACDMTHFMSSGTPTFVFGPGSLNQAHKPNEYCEIEELRVATNVYEALARHFLKCN